MGKPFLSVYGLPLFGTAQGFSPRAVGTGFSPYSTRPGVAAMAAATALRLWQ